MSFLARLRRSPLQNTGSTARDHLASERTFLAWMRTGLGFVALGIAIERFNQLPVALATSSLPVEARSAAPERSQADDVAQDINKGHEQLLVASLLGTGAGCVAYGTRRYFVNYRLLQMGQFRAAYYGTATMGVAVAGLATLAWYGSLKQERSRGKS